MKKNKQTCRRDKCTKEKINTVGGLPVLAWLAWTCPSEKSRACWECPGIWLSSPRTYTGIGPEWEHTNKRGETDNWKHEVMTGGENNGWLVMARH